MSHHPDDEAASLSICDTFSAFCDARSVASAEAHEAAVVELSAMVASYRGAVRGRSPDHIRMGGRRIRARLAKLGAEGSAIAREAVLACGGTDDEAAAFAVEFVS